MDVNGAAGNPAPGAATVRSLIRFCHRARQAGLGVTSGKVLDSIRSVAAVELSRREDVRVALRANLASSREEATRFDALFDQFWHEPADGEDAGCGEEGEGDPLGRPGAAPGQTQLLAEAGEEGGDDERKDKPPEGLKAMYSPVEVLAQKDFGDLAADELRAIQKLLDQIAIKLATRLSRRRRPDRRGREVDFRRTFRGSLKYFGEPVVVARRARRIQKTDLLLLCDVSGSMDVYSRFLVQFIYGLQRHRLDVETFVFSTRLSRITPLLERADFTEAFRRVSQQVHDWSGGTDIGGCLKNFNERWARQVMGRRTVSIIISDGWDRGEAGLLAREMYQLRSGCYKVVWLNPLLADPAYEPLCKGMAAALPYVDYFLPFANLASVQSLGKTLLRLRR
ncbi:MAG TPA: VWA domain-containing protein [Candidatus Methylomirabilis sp.]|jgi:uncharacterized protein with von Willebrand factor type A (vWA) domain